jgi:hypothetical protein
MWFTRQIFELCQTLKEAGIQPRFEIGDVVARGFADLGFEEFQVLPGPKLLSLTAGTASALLDEHRHFFFWIPSVDETVMLLEREGAKISVCHREDARQWVIKLTKAEEMGQEEREELESFRAQSIHQAMLAALCYIKRKS